MRNRFGWVVAAACLSMIPESALAQGRPITLADRAGGRDHALELELDFNSIGEDGPDGATYTTLLPKVYGSFGLTEDLELEVTLPLIFEDEAPEMGEGDSTLLLANPYFALFYADRSARSVARIGFGVALPVLDQDGAIDRVATLMAVATRGLMDVWLYGPQRLSLVVPGQVQMRASMFVLGVDGALALLIPTSDDYDPDPETQVMLQAGALFGLGLGDLTIGLRMQVAAMVTEDDGDLAQASLMPFVQADLDGGGFVHGGLLINLDDPYGFFGDNDADVWALRVGGGARF